MTKEEFKQIILAAVEEYLENEENYGDCAQLEIDPKNLKVAIMGADDDSDEKDYYLIMDMVKGSETDPGTFIPDDDTIDELVAEYISIIKIF